MTGRMRIRSAAGVAGLVALAAALAWIPARADEEDDRAAVTAATEQAARWLDALDAGQYVETWNDAAAVMKAGRTQEEWVSDVASPRAALGKAVMRELQHAVFSTSVRGAPEGKYVTATYLTQFVKTPPTVETILLTAEDDHWRIAGYDIAPAPAVPPPSPPNLPPAGAKAEK
jgi:predicted RNA-binding Zn ribbon-like protein